MASEELFLRRAVVFGSALVYWVGVLVQARRVRRRIGRSPALKPRGTKERLLWAGWGLVIVAWMALPFLTGGRAAWSWLRFFPNFVHPAGLALGLALIVAGYAGTLWCYATLGDTWRMGVNRAEKSPLVTRGPYRRVRHPIYLFQIIVLAGVAILLPTAVSLMMLLLHLLCVLVKALDEEAHLLTVHGRAYRDYLSRTGRFFPRFLVRESRVE
jgi:protein-S-isoprenylcysteine O-methyltransferase Ste14